ncbi:thymidylate synthase [Pseudomonas phage vB_PpuM-Pori-4]
MNDDLKITEVNSVKEYDEHVRNLLVTLLGLGSSATRNDQGTRKLGATSISFNLLSMYPSIPMTTLRPISWASILGEMLGFIRGETNVQAFKELGTNVWNANAKEPAWKNNALAPNEGDLGPIYGKQWRKWTDTKLLHERSSLRELGYTRMGHVSRLTGDLPHEGPTGDGPLYVWVKEVDQLMEALNRIKANPNDRRAVISAWNPGDMDFMALPPCHVMMQLTTVPYAQHKYGSYTDGASDFEIDFNENYPEQVVSDTVEPNSSGETVPRYALNLVVTQRSQDTLLGRAYNIPAYATLLRLFAHLLEMAPGNLEFNVGDQHLYSNHGAAADEVTCRESLDKDEEGEKLFQLSIVGVDKFEDLDTLTADNFILTNQVTHDKLESDTKMTV